MALLAWILASPEADKRVIIGMLFVGLVFIGVIALGETSRWLSRRRGGGH